MSPRDNIDRRWNESAKYVHVRSISGAVGLLTPREWDAALQRAARNPEDLEPRPDPQPEPPVEPEPEPEPEPQPEPAAWATGRWALSIDGQPGALDFDAGTVTLPQFGNLMATFEVVGERATARFPLGVHGEGLMFVSARGDALTGYARAADQEVQVTGQREAEPQPEPEQPAPEEPGEPPVQPPTGEGVFADSFESGDLSKTGGPGFRWASSSSAIKREGARTGSYAMHLPFGPVEPNGNSHWWTERRFSFNPSREFWMEFWWFVPSNFRHSGSPSNNKFLAWWGPNGYSKPGMGMYQFWARSGGSYIDCARYGPRSTYAEYVGPKPLFIESSMLGKYTRIRAHIRLADVGKANGVQRLWKGDNLLLDITGDANSADRESANVLSAGYLMGYDNSGYAETTTFRIDDFVFTTRNPGW